jgi:hypothetical protein
MMTAVTSFALLADPKRMRMPWALRETDLDVPSLAAMVYAYCGRVSPDVASQPLWKLRFKATAAPSHGRLTLEN